jgi:hypothetical protein
MKKTAIATAFCIGVISTGLHAAPINPSINDRFALRGGPFFASMDTKVKVGTEEQTFEDYLDDSKTTAAIQGIWRISKHFRLNFGYWAVNRDESESSDQNFTIGGITIPAGSSVGATFDSSLGTASLGWSFVANDTTEFGVDLGIAALGLKSELGASVPGVGEASFTAFDETYPLPVLGLYVDHALSPMWSIAGRVSGVGLTIGDDFDGNLINASGGVEVRPWKNFGFGLAYLYSSADAKLNNVIDDKAVNVDWTYQGPFAYITLGFGEVR